MKRKLNAINKINNNNYVIDNDDLDNYDDDNINNNNIKENYNNKKSKKLNDDEIIKLRNFNNNEKKNIVKYRNKQRTLIFCSRGVTSRYRNLMNDLKILLVNHKTDFKHDTKKRLFEINEIAELKSCNNVIFFEVRKKKDLYLWMTKSSSGPSLKFLVTNIHTMDELKLTGNSLKGSRAILSFSKEFDNSGEQFILVKEMLKQLFNVPKGHTKSKPFIDHIFQFTLIDGKIYFRNYQITDSTYDKKERKRAQKIGKQTTQLVEIGPRMTLDLIKITDGSFSGRPLYENSDYQSPNFLRSLENSYKGEKYSSRRKAQANTKERKQNLDLPVDELKAIFKN